MFSTGGSAAGVYTLGTAVMFVGLFVALVLLARAVGLPIPLGVGQRIGFGVWYLWAVVLAGWMLAREASPTPASNPADP